MAKATREVPAFVKAARAADVRYGKAAVAAEDQAMKAATEAAPSGPVTELEKKLAADVERLKERLSKSERLNGNLSDTNYVLRETINVLAEQITNAHRQLQKALDDAIPF